MSGFALSAFLHPKVAAIHGENYDGTIMLESCPGGTVFTQQFSEIPIGAVLPMPMNYSNYKLPDVELTMESSLDAPLIGEAMRTPPGISGGSSFLVA